MQRSLIGRKKELSRAAESLRRATSATAVPLLITGDAGYGKSTVLDRIVCDAVAMGFGSFVIRADEVDGGVPYAPLYAALGSNAGAGESTREQELAEVIERAMLGVDPSDVALRSRVLELLRRAIADRAYRQPMIVAFDDLHVADAGSRAAALFLMRHLRRERVLLVVTSRSGSHDLDPATADALARFHAAGSIDLLELGPFDHDEVTAVVAARFDAEPDPSLVQALTERTAGNPFFVAELVDALASTSVVSVAAGRIRVASTSLPAMPHSVSTAVLHRVFQLGPAARSVASATSVTGPIDARALPLVAQLCGLEVSQVEDAADVLVASRVLVESDGCFRFAHPIVRDALYNDLGPGERSRIHTWVARHLVEERTRGGATSVVEIATHARRSQRGELSATAELFLEAGEALLYDEPSAALEWLDQALAAWPPDAARRPAVLVARCRALHLAGRHAEAAQDALDLVGAMPAGPEKHDAVLVAARALTACDRLDEAAEVLESALREPALLTARLLIESGFVALWRQDLDEAAGRLQQAEAVGSVADAALIELLHARLDLERGRHRAGFERVGVLASRLGELDPPLRRSTALGLFACASIHGDPRALLDGITAVDQTGLAEVPAFAEWHHTFRAWACFRTGHWDDAMAEVQLALISQEAPATHAAAVAAGAIRTAIDAERGVHSASFRHPCAAGSESMFGYLVTWATALDAMHAGHADHAVEVLRPVCERAPAQLAPSARSLVLGLAAEAACKAGDLGWARRVNDELQALPRDSDGVAVSLRCLLAQAQVESDGDAAQRARAVALERGLAFDAARAVCCAGVIQRDADRLAAAHDEFGRIGAVVRQREATHELRKLGRRAPRQRRAGTLTAVELEIASLVAEGLSNREIAARSLLSPKTVEVYLSRIYAKARCRSRVELAVLVDSGRLPPSIDEMVPERADGAGR